MLQVRTLSKGPHDPHHPRTHPFVHRIRGRPGHLRRCRRALHAAVRAHARAPDHLRELYRLAHHRAALLPHDGRRRPHPQRPRCPRAPCPHGTQRQRALARLHTHQRRVCELHAHHQRRRAHHLRPAHARHVAARLAPCPDLHRCGRNSCSQPRLHGHADRQSAKHLPGVCIPSGPWSVLRHHGSAHHRELPAVHRPFPHGSP